MPLLLVAHGAHDPIEAIQVLDLASLARHVPVSILAARTHAHVHVGPELAMLHVRVRDAAHAEQLANSRDECRRILAAAHVRLTHHLQQGASRSSQIDN